VPDPTLSACSTVKIADQRPGQINLNLNTANLTKYGPVRGKDRTENLFVYCVLFSRGGVCGNSKRHKMGSAAVDARVTSDG